MLTTDKPELEPQIISFLIALECMAFEHPEAGAIYAETGGFDGVSEVSLWFKSARKKHPLEVQQMMAKCNFSTQRVLVIHGNGKFRVMLAGLEALERVCVTYSHHQTEFGVGFSPTPAIASDPR